MTTPLKTLNNLQGDWTKFHIEVKFLSIPVKECPQIGSSRQVYDLIKSFTDLPALNLQEYFLALYFKANSRFIGYRLISIGNETQVLVDTNLIVSLALHTRAYSVIVVHNHPSGNMAVSRNDMNVTEKLRQGLRLIDVRLSDHIIISPFDDFLSFADNGLL